MLLVNVYVAYKETHHLVWKTAKKKILTHYQFRRAITIAWLTGNNSVEERDDLGSKQN
jgi:hypothetical protein